MAQYDGSIRINTKITTKEASAQLMTLENRIVKTADKIASLRSKMDSLKDSKIPTQEYSEITSQIQKAEAEFNKLLEKQEQMQHEGKDNGVAWDRLNAKMEEVGNTIRYAQGELQDLVDTGKAFTLGSDTEEFAKLGQQLKYAENDMAVLNQRHDVLRLKQEKAAEGYKKLGDMAKKSFNSIGNVLKKANSHVNSFGKRLKDIAHRILPAFHKETKRTNTVLGQFSTRLKSLLPGIFIFNVISSYIRKMFSGINEGFENFYNQNSVFKSSVDSMRTSLLQLKNAFAAAFAPIVSVAIPYLEKLISYITRAVNSIGQLIAALVGKKTYTRAIRVNVENLEDTSDALEEVKEEAKEAEKALNGYLSPLDEINKYSEDKEIKVDIDTPKKPDASDIGDTMQDMFEEVPIDSYFLDLAEKMKDIFSQIFAPLKEAWNREGKFVMDSWKYALKEVGDLLKSIGSDFLEVWQQEKTIKIFEDLLHIIGDIGLVVGNLAHNFRLAWEENDTGKRILEGIRDIIGVIVANIRHAADATVEWSKNLNFSPLLTAIKGWVESLVPVFDNLSGIITDFYEKVLLPLGKWTLEKGLPELLQVFIDFNNKVDWEALRSRLAQFWEHLEPFAETVGEGLIIFIERCANALADFINSPAFGNFLTMIENWMDSVKPEDVADALEAIAKAIISLKVAVVGFSVASKGIMMLSKLADILKLFGAGSGIAGGASSLGLSAGALGQLSETLKNLGNNKKTGNALASLGKEIEGLKDKLDSGKISIEEFNSQRDALVAESQKELRFEIYGLDPDDYDTDGVNIKFKEMFEGISTNLKQSLEGMRTRLEIWWSETWMADTIWKFGQWWEEKVKPWFAQEKWSELWEGIRTSFSTKWGELVEWWGGTAIVGWWEEHVAPWFTAEKWMELFENIKTSLKEVWDNTVGQWAGNISAWWDEHVAPWFTREKWEEILKSVPEAFGSGFAKVVDIVKEKIQGVIDWVVEKVDWLKEKVEGIKETFNGFKSRVRGFFGGSSFSTSSYSSVSYSRMASPLYQNPAFASLSTTPIPALARGAVIPANREFLAVLGDQKHGTNIEAPLDMIKQAQKESILEVLSALGLTGTVRTGSSQPKEIVLKVDRRELGRVMIDEGNLQMMATGKNMFMLGIT